MNMHLISSPKQKKVVYQVFPRLFGNTNTTNKTWGSIIDNGVGKFNDFTVKALTEIKNLGVTHIWFTGILHHAMLTDYTAYGISNDHPDVVKGRAGSPYAVKDYYNVNPDLAENPNARLDEFLALIQRTHQQGMKVIIDIVPNHVARHYEGKCNPIGVENFGFHDDTSLIYHKDNNFYYNPGEHFVHPEWLDNYQPLGGEKNALLEIPFDEFPAKWTGNGSRLSQPHFHDWYETVKLNFGISPEGHKEFDSLPEGFDQKDYKEHFTFWQGKCLPDTWNKFKDIVLYWIDKGVDGFRYDMAEMVAIEFWSFLNSTIKMSLPDAFLIAEVYNTALYRDFIQLGKMDYLYDKVELYDSLKRIIQGKGNTDEIPLIINGQRDIEHHLLHFMENHDEQRIASPEFAGSAIKGKPAMLLSACISTSPTMIYFGQEVGEAAAENAGFGSSCRTSIFDYIGVPHHQRWLNDKKFDGGQLLSEEKDLRDFYQRLLQFSIQSLALTGEYQEIHTHNRSHTPYYNHHVFSFVRYTAEEKLIIVVNFDAKDGFGFDLEIPTDLLRKWGINDGEYLLKDQLYQQETTILNVMNGIGKTRVTLRPLESFIYKVEIGK
ncbi:MAG: alpha-amylase family protein [Bacteroidales bacterium]